MREKANAARLAVKIVPIVITEAVIRLLNHQAAGLPALPRLLEEAVGLEPVLGQQLGRELLEQAGGGEGRDARGVHDGHVGRRAADRRQRQLRVVGVAPRQDQLAHVAVPVLSVDASRRVSMIALTTRGVSSSIAG
jgi:hypothetical protein